MFNKEIKKDLLNLEMKVNRHIERLKIIESQVDMMERKAKALRQVLGVEVEVSFPRRYFKKGKKEVDF